MLVKSSMNVSKVFITGCSEPVSNSTITYSVPRDGRGRYPLGTTATYGISCNQDNHYATEGDIRRTCNSVNGSASWTGKEPVCRGKSHDWACKRRCVYTELHCLPQLRYVKCLILNMEGLLLAFLHSKLTE